MESLPGERYRYSNGGYGLLAAVIEKVSGQSYESYVRENLFQPASMTCSGFYNHSNRNDPQVALGYDGSRSWPPAMLEHSWFRQLSALLGSWLRLSSEAVRPATLGPGAKDWSVRGAGAVVTTVGDLYKWEQALRGENILSAQAKRKFFRPYLQIPNTNEQYAYGWQVARTARGTTLVYHTGNYPGFKSAFWGYVDEDLVVILASNISHGDRRESWRPVVRNAVEAVVFGEDYTLLIVLVVLAIAVVSVGAWITIAQSGSERRRGKSGCR